MEVDAGLARKARHLQFPSVQWNGLLVSFSSIHRPVPHLQREASLLLHIPVRWRRRDNIDTNRTIMTLSLRPANGECLNLYATNRMINQLIHTILFLIEILQYRPDDWNQNVLWEVFQNEQDVRTWDSYQLNRGLDYFYQKVMSKTPL